MPHRALPFLLLAALTGCTHWVKDESVLAASAPDPRKQFQVFTPTDVIRAHSIRSDSTILSYVSFVQPPDCDSCRVAIPLASVDSVRTGEVSAKRTFIFLGSLIAMLALIATHVPPET